MSTLQMGTREKSAAFAGLDRWLLWSLAFICLMALVNLASAGQTLPGRPVWIAQAAAMAAGMILFTAAALFDMKSIERWAYWFYAAGTGLLVSVHYLGFSAGGAKSWLRFGPVGLQPSEPMKIVLIVALARLLVRQGLDRPVGFSSLPKILALVVPPLALILKEPDVGTAVIYVATIGTMLMYVGLDRSLRRLIIGSSVIVVGGLAIYTFVLGQDPLQHLKAHHRKRLIALVDLESDPKGVGYQQIQAKIAIGSGGTGGLGWTKGRQSQFSYVPKQHTDFAFCVFAEEWGFFWAAALVVAYFILLVRGAVAAAESREPFGTLVCIGVISMLFWHLVINLGMNLAVMPVIGIPLPLFSAGGSSVLAIFMGLGLIQNVYRDRFLF